MTRTGTSMPAAWSRLDASVLTDVGWPAPRLMTAPGGRSVDSEAWSAAAMSETCTKSRDSRPSSYSGMSRPWRARLKKIVMIPV